MSASRYQNNSLVPQPVKKILPSATDIAHPFKIGERIDNLAQKYYSDVTLGWVIMAGNPEYENEFDIPFGVTLRIPYPLQRVFDMWLLSSEI